MHKKFIQSREEVSLLVRTFYGKVRKDDLLGPIFNGIIKDWEEHLELLTDFWETQLLYKRKYYGNPMMAHVEVDHRFGRVGHVGAAPDAGQYRPDLGRPDPRLRPARRAITSTGCPCWRGGSSRRPRCAGCDRAPTGIRCRA
mgnify:CR=1 FL=1